jgi:hypothetical protein
MKNILSVDISKIEQCWAVDLHEFEPGVTYPLAKLMDTLGFMNAGRQKHIRGRNKN